MYIDLVAASQEAAGGDPEQGRDGEGHQEEMLGGVQVEPKIEIQKKSAKHKGETVVVGVVGFGPNRDEGVIVGVVVAGEGVPAGLVPAVPPVLNQEGCALELQRVHTHLTVYEQLK